MSGTPGVGSDGSLAALVHRLIGQVENLTLQVAALAEHISISKDTSEAATRAAHRSNVLTRIAVAVAVVCLLTAGGVVYLFRDAHHNAVTSCRNANESRAGNLAAWEFLIDASIAGGQNAKEADLTRRFRHWIRVVYQPHDCSHLDRVYPIPDPPTLK